MTGLVSRSTARLASAVRKRCWTVFFARALIPVAAIPTASSERQPVTIVFTRTDLKHAILFFEFFLVLELRIRRTSREHEQPAETKKHDPTKK